MRSVTCPGHDQSTTLSWLVCRPHFAETMNFQMNFIVLGGRMGRGERYILVGNGISFVGGFSGYSTVDFWFPQVLGLTLLCPVGAL